MSFDDNALERVRRESQREARRRSGRARRRREQELGRVLEVGSSAALLARRSQGHVSAVAGHYGRRFARTLGWIAVGALGGGLLTSILLTRGRHRVALLAASRSGAPHPE